MIPRSKKQLIKDSKHIKLLATTAMILLLFGSFVTAVRADARQLSEGKKIATIGLRIVDAYYADLDNDGYEDDILGIIKITMTGVNVANMEYVISLTLPSGTIYSYLVKITTNQDVIVLKNFFWDHAYESGDYTLKVTLNLINYEKITVSETYTFDPPGSSQGGEPTFDVV